MGRFPVDRLRVIDATMLRFRKDSSPSWRKSLKEDIVHEDKNGIRRSGYIVSWNNMRDTMGDGELFLELGLFFF